MKCIQHYRLLAPDQKFNC